ncbi:unannotated protein [freshwater metagenome]|uniref:Unannotated protein n=1 Tax=freshwater metagenome TaxID=449393 RepID=A0A6J7F911_9ZZZZ|nr:hypothetical protein [Actinomycetota bacterium]
MTLPPPVGAPEIHDVQHAPRSPIPFTVLVAFVGLGSAFLGSFLPWAQVLFITINGTDGDGNITAVASAAALALLVGALRSGKRQVLLTSLASVAALAAAGTYIYDLSRISGFASDLGSSANIFNVSVTPQLGLLLGTVGAVVAVVSCLALVVAARRGGLIREPMPDWRSRDLAILVAATLAMTMAAVPRWWVVTAIAAVASGVLWMRWAAPRRLASAVGLMAFAGTLLAAGGAVGGALYQSAQHDSAGRECSEVFADGASVDDVSAVDTCVEDKKPSFVFNDSTTCKDGTVLYVNEHGWGYAGGKWSTADNAPRGRCNSNATESCANIFKNGATTETAWADDTVECFDATGDVAYEYGYSMGCFDSNKTQIINDLGWGYVGEQWHAGEQSPTC